MEAPLNKPARRRIVIAARSNWPLTPIMDRLTGEFDVVGTFFFAESLREAADRDFAPADRQPAGGDAVTAPVVGSKFQRLISATASADLILTFGIYALPKRLTAQINCASVNVHPTVLPAFKGEDALYWARFNKSEDKLGFSLHITNGKRAGTTLHAERQDQPDLRSDEAFYRQIGNSAAEKIIEAIRHLQTETTGEFTLNQTDASHCDSVDFLFPPVSPVFARKLEPTPRLAKAVKLLAKRLLLATKKLDRYEGSGAALFAHRILDDEIPPDDWRRILGYTSKTEIVNLIRELKKHYELVSIERITEIVRSGFKQPRPVISLSFDDGYRDVCDNGLEICETEKVPLDLFVSTAVIDGHRPYHQQMYDLVDAVSTSYLFLPCADMRLVFDSPLHRILIAEYVILPFLKTLSVEDRTRVIRDIETENKLHDHPSTDEFCTQEDLRRVDQSEYFGVHLHGHLHEPFENMSPQDLAQDLHHSTQSLKHILGRDSNILSYPNGMYHAEQLSILRKHHIKWAFTVEDSAMSRMYCPPLELPRLGLVNDDVTDTLWRINTAFERIAKLK